MRLYKKEKAFVFECEFEERHTPKEANFIWHPRPCYKKGCQACRYGVGKNWWTSYEDNAIQLIEYADEDTRKYLEGWQKEKEDRIAASKAKTANIDVPTPDGLSLYPFQKAGVKFLAEHKNALLADKFGLGKTLQVIGLINYLQEINKVLIVCPASMKLVWKSEIEKWFIKKIPVFIVNDYKGRLPQRQKIIIIVNYEVFSRKNKMREQIRNQEYDLLVLDEAHYIKHGSKTNRGKYIIGGGKERIKPIKAKRNIFLTATPITNRPIELWPLIHFLDRENWNNYIWYTKRFCGAYMGDFGWEVSGASNLDELQERLRSTIMIRRSQKDVLPELPSKTRQVIEISAPELEEIIKKEWETYQKVKEAVRKAREQLQEIKNTESEEYREAVKKLKKAQSVAFEEIALIRKETAVRKIPFVIEYLREVAENEEKVIVFAHHKVMIDALIRAFGSKAVKIDGSTPQKERMEAINRFQNDPNTQFFIGSILACGTGITLTASSFVLFAELDWVPANMAQAEGRALRIGQKSHVLVQYIVIEGSIDAEMAKTLARKEEIINIALDQLGDEIL